MSSQDDSSQERNNGGKERKTKDKRKNKNNSKGNIFLRNLIDILNNNLKLKKVRNILAIILIALSVISVWSLFYFNNVLPNAEIYDVKFKVNSGNPEQPSLYIDARVYEPRIGMAGKTDEPRPLVVLVHGYAMSKEFMYSFSIELARRGVSSISFSMPGHGFSGPPYYFTNVSTRAVSEAINFMLNNSKFPIDTARLGVIGHSMGAMTAIKAGYLDHRLCFTIALAAPSGETRLLISSPEFNLNFLNESIPSYTNLTYPRNLYFILGKNDEFVKDIDARLIMSKAIGISADEIQINQVYNENFTAGTSRKYSLYPLMDHLTESISPRSVGDALDWVARSFQIDPNIFNKNIKIVSLYRFLIGAVGLVSAWLIPIPLSNIMFELIFKKTSFAPRSPIDLRFKKSKEEKDANIKDIKGGSLKNLWNLMDRDTKIAKDVIFLALMFFLITAGLGTFISILMKPKYPIGGSLLTDSLPPIFAIFSVAAIINYWVITKKVYSGKNKKNSITVELPRFWSLNNEDLSTSNAERASDGKAEKEWAIILKYVLYMGVSFIVPVILVQYIMTNTLFSIFIAPYRLKSFFISFILILPFNMVIVALLNRPIYLMLIKKFHTWLTRIITPLITTPIISFALVIGLSFSIGAPLVSGLTDALLFWGALLTLVIFLIQISFASWYLYWDFSIYGSAFVSTLVIAILINVAFPVCVLV